MSIGRTWLLLAALLVLGSLPAVAAACPNCVNSVAENASTGDPGTTGSMAGGIGGSMAAGYYYSILFMLAVLFTLVGTLIYVIYRHARITATPDPTTPA